MKVNGVLNVFIGNDKKKNEIKKKRIKAIQETNRVFVVYDKNGRNVTDSISGKKDSRKDSLKRLDDMIDGLDRRIR